jgi:hypothetical protein
MPQAPALDDTYKVTSTEGRGLYVNRGFEGNVADVTYAMAISRDHLGRERLTGLALDRLTHRCHILETKGESYRLQDAKRRRRRPD